MMKAEGAAGASRCRLIAKPVLLRERAWRLPLKANNLQFRRAVNAHRANLRIKAGEDRHEKTVERDAHA